MEQAIPVVSGGNAQGKAFESAGIFKMTGASSDKIKAACTQSGKEEEDPNAVVPFLNILNQQISRTSKSSDDDTSSKGEENIALQKLTSLFPGGVTLKELQQALANLTESQAEAKTDDAKKGRTEISFDSLLKEIDSLKNNSTSGDIKTDSDTLTAEKVKFKEQGMEKQLSEVTVGKTIVNLTEVKDQNKIATARSGKEDSASGNNARLNMQEMKESLVSKDAAREYSNSANAKAENKAQADTMQAIMGEATGKIKVEQKGKIVSGEKGNEEISLTGVSTAGGGSASTEKTNDVSPDKIISRITGEIKEAAVNDGGRVKITLNPPSLGKLEMDVTVRNGKIEVVLVADNKDVQQTLNAHIDRLKESLQNQGLTIERCDVSMQDKREEYQQSFSKHAFYQDGRSAQDGNDRRKNSDEEVNVSAATIIAEKPGSVLRASTDTDNISLFA